MSVNCRFALDEKRYVIDAINVANSGKVYWHEDDPEDDKHLREGVLMNRLSGMTEKLIINLRPQRKSLFCEEYRPRNEESDSICMAALYAIKASHLNTFDPAMSIQHKFDGNLRCQKKGAQDFTSLALFRDDVECLLRDLYGDVESDALDSIVWVVFRIVERFTKYVHPDLWKEHQDAVRLDYMLGIGVPERCSIGGSDWRRGMAAKFWLILRVYEVQQEPSAFSDYTIDFANRFNQQWDCSLNSVRELIKQYLPGNPDLRDTLERSPAFSRILPKDII
jgi:hypothetical protein